MSVDAPLFSSVCCILSYLRNIKKTLVQTLAIPRNARVASPYFCAEEATTCEALNLKDGVSALQVCSAPSLESATTRRH